MLVRAKHFQLPLENQLKAVYDALYFYHRTIAYSSVDYDAARVLMSEIAALLCHLIHGCAVNQSIYDKIHTVLNTYTRMWAEPLKKAGLISDKWASTSHASLPVLSYAWHVNMMSVHIFVLLLHLIPVLLRII